VTRALVAALVMVTAATAHAETTKMFPLAGTGDTPKEMTHAIARVLHGDVATVSIEDAAGLLACDATETECLEAVARSVSAARIAYGSLRTTPDGVEVTLVWLDKTGRHEHAFALSGATTEELVSDLVDQAREVFDGKKRKPPKSHLEPTFDTQPTPHGETPPIGDQPPEQPGASDGPTKGTWAILISGLGVTCVGAGFLVAANSLRGEVNSAPTETSDDFDHLLALENAGRLRTEIGAGLMIAGGVTTAIGVVRMVIQKQRASAREHSRIQVKPESGGASVVVSWRWP
jgi:hypothetical protein